MRGHRLYKWRWTASRGFDASALTSRRMPERPRLHTRSACAVAKPQPATRRECQDLRETLHRPTVAAHGPQQTSRHGVVVRRALCNPRQASPRCSHVLPGNPRRSLSLPRARAAKARSVARSVRSADPKRALSPHTPRYGCLQCRHRDFVCRQLGHPAAIAMHRRDLLFMARRFRKDEAPDAIPEGIVRDATERASFCPCDQPLRRI